MHGILNESRRAKRRRSAPTRRLLTLHHHHRYTLEPIRTVHRYWWIERPNDSIVPAAHAEVKLLQLRQVVQRDRPSCESRPRRVQPRG
ncbi:MAG: hypothetical protein AABZ12_03200 [Planctomycetota bacterium]